MRFWAISLYFSADSWRIRRMFDIFTHGIFAGFIVATPMGLTQLIAFERTLNRSFKSGWLVALGGTCASLIFATLAVCGITLTSDWIPFGRFSELILTHKLEIIALLGMMMFVMGLIYLSKKPYKPTKVAEAGFAIGLMIPLIDVGNIATHTAALSTNGMVEYTIAQAIVAILAITLGVHISWMWKLSVVQLGKRHLLRKNVQNFNRVFGFMLIGMAISTFIIIGYILII